MELMMQDEFDRAILYPGAWTTKIVTAYAAALARIAALEAERRWIPVSERLPEEGIKVNILYDTPCVEDEPEVAVYMGDDLWAIAPEEYLDRVYCKVTHWMPLPPAPE